MTGPQTRLFSKLTIVIPAFNCARYLPAAVASALHTPAGRVWIADDGSGPEALRVAERLAAANPERVRVFASTANRGTAVNLNETIGRVETEFVAKLDGDDVLIPGHLESALPLIAQRPRLAVLAGRDLRIGADEATVFRPESMPKAPTRPPVRIMAGAEAWPFIVAWNPNPTSSGVIYRTRAFREVGGFDPLIPWGEDWEIWLRFARQWEVGFVDAPSALYRIHPQSATASAARHERLCYGYDAVFRRAAELCDYPELLPLVRRRMFWVVKLYAAAAVRQFRSSPSAALECVLGAARTLSAALRTGRGRAPVVVPDSPLRSEVEPVRAEADR
jgi:glycosyltransferase involved in cell wall biosynthesis